jgi:hypothetical protein
MSKPRQEELERARKMLVRLVAKMGAWREWQRVKHFQEALTALAADEAVVEVVAQFGDKIPLMPYFFPHELEELVGRLMLITAYAWADPTCQPVPAKEIVMARESWEKARSKAMALPPSPVRNAYLRELSLFEKHQMPLDDPVVERRPPTRKEFERFEGDLVVYAHARAVWGRVQAEAHNFFGEAGAHIADVFVTAVSGIYFGPDDRKARTKRKRSRRLALSGGRLAGRQIDPE